jgi:hypothetical protein
MPEREVFWNFSGFSKRTNETYRFFGIFRLKRLYLTCFVEERSWGFFGGSIDTVGYSCIFY